ncbi:ATP-dependent helicase [Taibaiella sp. KBW10]|uniref:DEAD/DEAH box helicase n=1 Tax=Taibaiella sp. KBW10 TaxID=2153357 RepID=UPI000F598761|nr:DEAD/DEAH box helicase [Taibaiella sp. KBW10]RQO32523.1 ATP-dependent helicase [Taibaiella sp. KBW10]
MKFEQYHIATELKRSLDELGFKKPTDIQFKAIGPVLQGNDVLAVAQTGTGKTAAFVIPVLHKLMYIKNPPKQREAKCLVMVPTRELAIQIAKVFRTIGKYTKLKTTALLGGVEQEHQIEQLANGTDVLIATPGRMFDLIYQKKLDLNKTEILVLDEADLMLDYGFIKDIQDVIKFLPDYRQTLFFSATINSEIKEIAYGIVRNPIRIQISPQDPISKNITHFVAHIEMDDKRYFLERLVTEHPEAKILIFVRTKVRAERVASAMERVQIKALTMHSGKDQSERAEIMDSFKNGIVKLLITTDLNARGVDIPNVDYVVNYDLPEEAENYVHRVGRTGRGVQKGIAYSFCSKDELPVLKTIEQYLGNKINVLDIDPETYSDTILFTEEVNDSNWKALLKENEALEAKKSKKSKKK